MILLKIALALACTCLLPAQDPGPPKQQKQPKERRPPNPRAEERRQREQAESAVTVYADTVAKRYYRSRCDKSPGLMAMTLRDAKKQGLASASCKQR